MWDLVLDWRLPFAQTRLALARTETLPWRTQNITTVFMMLRITQKT
jgi:hypothetical protein